MAQQDDLIAPLKLDLKNTELLEMLPLDNKKLFKDEMKLRKKGRPNHFAHTFTINQSTNEIGKWTSLPDGSSVWRLRIHSDKAKSLNLGFSKYQMPPGGSLMLYTPDYENILGPFTPADNEEHEELWTPIIEGDDIIVEVWLKENNKSNLELELKSVNHDFMGVNSIISGSCNLDVICGEVDGWGIVDNYRDIIQSVALTQLNGSLRCTGFLVNNTAEDCKPLFMTANHCELTENNAASLVTYWNYENSTCRQPNSTESGNNGDGSFADFNTGSFLRAFWEPSDFTIVELDDPVSPTSNSYRAGWNAAENLPPDTVLTIHHPSRDEKRISFATEPVFIGDWNGSNTQDHVEVPFWDIGTTEGGSSGSPLFDNEKRVIGQLHGGSASCTSNTSDSFGWLNISWDGGGTPETRLKDWLDPTNSGVMTMSGISCGCNLVPDISSLEICAPDDAIYQLTVSDEFSNNVTLSISDLPADFSFNFSNASPAPGEVTILTVSNTANVSFGEYPFTIDVTDGDKSSTTNLDLIIYDGIPDQATLTAPVDMSTENSTIPFFEWEITSASTYEIQVATDDNFTNTVIENSMIESESYSINSFLEPETTYFWRVRGNNLCGTGEWTSTHSFSTSAVVCNSDIAEGLPIVIDDGAANTITSSIEINENGPILDVNVLGIKGSHDWISDLTFVLESPEGTSVVLISTACGNDLNFDINFDSQSTGVIPCPYTDGGTYPPLNSLNAFNGENAEGTWTLSVIDEGSGDGGSLDNWELDICTAQDGVSAVEQSADQDFDLYPNPSQGNLTIRSSFTFKDNVQGQIYDVNGKVVGQFEITNGQRVHHLDLSALTSGIYIVKFSNPNFVRTKKIVLNQ